MIFLIRALYYVNKMLKETESFYHGQDLITLLEGPTHILHSTYSNVFLKTGSFVKVLFNVNVPLNSV